ncbi:hypothetical protein AMTRI_Chr02g223020 [Amborella trichopoda]
MKFALHLTTLGNSGRVGQFREGRYYSLLLMQFKGRDCGSFIRQFWEGLYFIAQARGRDEGNSGRDCTSLLRHGVGTRAIQGGTARGGGTRDSSLLLINEVRYAFRE